MTAGTGSIATRGGGSGMSSGTLADERPGFDAHAEDPLAWMNVTEDGFRELARLSLELAPHVAAVLEGGYNLATLPSLVAAAIDGFNSTGG